MSYEGLYYPAGNKSYLKEIKKRGYFILVDRSAKNIKLVAGGDITYHLNKKEDLLFIFGLNVAGTRQDIIDSLYLSGFRVEDISKFMESGISGDNVGTEESKKWISWFKIMNAQVETKVVSVKVGDIRPRYKNLEDWTNDPENVYIARKGVVFIEKDGVKNRFPKTDSIWANPYKISKKIDRDTCIYMYRTYITEKLNKGDISLDELLKLKGKTLGCWCKDGGEDIPCHGDVIVDLIDNYITNIF